MRSVAASVARGAPNFVTSALVLVVWQLLAGQVLPRINPASENIFPAPSGIILTAIQTFASGELSADIVASMSRVLAGFLFAAAIGVSLGLVMAALPALGRQMKV
ncbi:MAG: hypothetical protein ACRENA_16430, partial [Vulcanimicrobiaceae bacterium]